VAGKTPPQFKIANRPKASGINPQYSGFIVRTLRDGGKTMKNTAALHTLMVALILFAAAGVQYSADQQDRALLSAQGTSNMENPSASANHMADCSELDRDERALGWLAIVAAGFLVAAIVLYRLRDSDLTEPDNATIMF
jgi:hypothetical protein